MDVREQRGLRIADRYKLKPTNGIWRVPSESSNDRYKHAVTTHWSAVGSFV